MLCFQTQNCDWRNPSRRKRRDLAEEDISNTTTVASGNQKTDSLSENLSLFQAIHVLQSDDEDSNRTSASSFYKTEQDELTSQDTICVESMMFASVIGESHHCCLSGFIIGTHFS